MRVCYLKAKEQGLQHSDLGSASPNSLQSEGNTRNNEQMEGEDAARHDVCNTRRYFFDILFHTCIQRDPDDNLTNEEDNI